MRRYQSQGGDVLFFNTRGGSDLGDSCERDPDLVLADIARGLVSVQGTVDQTATVVLRKKIRATQEGNGLFNFGGTIVEIKARALVETQLAPPETPVFFN